MILAIDIGAYKISCAIGMVDKNGNVVIETASMIESKGFENGQITDHDMAVCTVSKILQQIRKKTRKKYIKVWCTVSGLKTISTWKKSTVHIDSGHVTPNDINKVIGQCIKVFEQDNRDNHRDFLHIAPFTYIVDTILTKKPHKLAGKNLTVYVLVCRGDSAILKNIHSVFEDLDVNIHRIAVNGYMSALAVLNEQEFDLDYVMCIDIGHLNMAVSLFYQGALVWCKDFVFGAGDIIKRIEGETAMRRECTEKFIKQGTVWVADLPHMDANRPMAYNRMGEQNKEYYITLGQISKIMAQEYTKMFENIKHNIPKQFGHIKRIVLTGGGSQTDGITDLVSTVMDANVRIGILPKKVLKNHSDSNFISAALVGLIKYSAHHISLENLSYNKKYTGTKICRIWQWVIK